MVARRFNRSVSRLLLGSLLGAGLLAGLVMFLAGLFALESFQTRSEQSSEHHIRESVVAQLIRDADLLAETLAHNLRDPLYHHDLSHIGSILRELSASSDIDYIYLLDDQGRIVHDGSRDIAFYGQPVLSHLPESVKKNARATVVSDEELLHIHKPIYVGDVLLGSIRFGITYTTTRVEVNFHAQQLAAEQASFHQRLWILLILVFLLLLVATLPLSIWLSRRVLAPLKELASRSQEYAKGNSDISFDLHRDDEIGQLGMALEDMMTRLDETHTEARKLAYQDTLTALPNRRQFYERLQQLVTVAQDSQQQFAMCFIDLDYFKQVNDTHGHDVGDELLKVATRRLRGAVERYQAKHPDLNGHKPVISRLGGDEFVLVIPCHDKADSQHFAEFLQQRFKRPVDIHGKHFAQSLSIGITYFPEQGITVKELLKNADIAMYEAKKAGRAGYREFDNAMRIEFQQRMLIKQSTSQAMRENEFFIEYQPIFCLEEQTIMGAEALLRWHHPELGRLVPGRFIDVQEESGMIAELTLWVLEQVCRDYRNVMTQWPDFKLSVNLSSRVFLDQAFSEAMLALLVRYEIPHGFLCVELTETDMMHDIQHCRSVMHAWRDAGVGVWIDDFGTGYSSLSYLNELPIDALKIDRSFVNELETGEIKPVIKVIHSLARSMGIQVVSEGIETARQLHLVTSLGSQFGQGYGLCRPVSIEVLANVYQNPAACAVVLPARLDELVD